MIKNFYQNLKLNSTNSISSNLIDFFKYYQIMQNINRYVLKNCENFEKLINIKKTFDNFQQETTNRDPGMESYYKKIFNKVENVFSSCESLNKNFEKLCFILEKNFKLDRLKNIEMSYILYNFFSLINKEIPFEVRNLFLMVDEYSIIENYASSFDEKRMNHPMIIKTDKGDGFIINYISQKLCDLIDYKKNDLIGRDMHVLIPNIFQEQHKLIMKKLIFLEFNSKIQKESFLITKNQFYFGVNIKGSFLPTINEHVILILDILPVLESKENRIRKVKYKFILDQNTNIISYSKNFEDNFFIDLYMFQKLEINFCQFFNINFDNLMKNCYKEIKKIMEINNLRTRDIMKIFHQVDLNEALFFLSEENNFDFAFSNIKKIPVHEFLRKKEKLIPTLYKIRKNIIEAEMGQEYLEKINELEKKLCKNSPPNKFVNAKRIVTKLIGVSSNELNEVVNGDKNNIYKNDQTFISIYLNNLGNLPFFLVTVIENVDNYEDDPIKDRSFMEQYSLNNKSLYESNINMNTNYINNNILNDSKILIENNFTNENNYQINIDNNINFDNVNNNSSNLENMNIKNLPYTNNNNLNFNQNTNPINLSNSRNTIQSNAFNKSKNGTFINSSQSVTKYKYNYLKNIKTNKTGILGSMNLFSTNSHENGNILINLPTIGNNNQLNNYNNSYMNDSVQQVLQFKNSNTNNNNSYINNYNNNLLNNFPNINFSKMSFKNASTFLSTYTSKSNYLLRVEKKRKNQNIKKGSQNKQEMDKQLDKKNKSFFSVMRNMSKDKIDSREKIIFVIIFLLLFIQIFLSFFSFSLKNGIAEYSFELFSINYYALLTKLSLYYTSSSVISACTALDIDPQNMDDFTLDIIEFQIQFKFRSNNLLKNLNKFMGILAKTDSSKNSDIYSLINSNIEFKILYSDWSFYTRNSTIIKEISYFHYYIAELQYPGAFSRCRLKSYFFNQNFINQKNNSYIDNDRNSETNANFEETVLYYIVYNIFQNFRENFEKITTNINNKLNDYLNTSQFTLLLFNLLTLLFGLSLIFIVTYSIKNYRQKILKLIFDIFIKDKTDPLFLEKLKNFMTIAKDFDKKICLLYEEENKRILIEEFLKTNTDNQIFMNDESQGFLCNNTNFGKILTTNINNNESNLQFLNKNQNKDSAARSKLKNKAVKEVNNNNNDNINKSINGTVSNNTNFRNEGNSDNTLTQSQKKFNYDFSKINMLIVKISYFILLIAFFCYLSLCLSNILINKSQYKSLLVANQISLNFLDRIPKFAELILYYRISVIFNNINFITKSQSEYKKLIYSDFFNQKYTPNTETLFNLLKESEFSHIYYNLNIVRKNIDMFMRSDDSIHTKVLPNIRKYEKKMNSPEFCTVYRLDNFKLIHDDKIMADIKTIFDSFKYLNSEARECLNIGNGINKYGMNIAFDSLLTSTKNLYLDFFRAGDKADITETLTNKNFIRAVLNIEYSFNKANMNYMNMILNDMTDLYDGVKNGEFIFSCAGLVFNLVFLIFNIFGVIKKLQRYFLSLNSAIDKFKVALVINDKENI